ncbi:hypothetical protein [Streptomyces niveus]|uniref:hypothetical protein n=1 Tax=Streptomyces niveus TaxID=193462 RepID=UPI0036D32AE5
MTSALKTWLWSWEPMLLSGEVADVDAAAGAGGDSGGGGAGARREELAERKRAGREGRWPRSNRPSAEDSDEQPIPPAAGPAAERQSLIERWAEPHGVDAARRLAEAKDLADAVAKEVTPTTLSTCDGTGSQGFCTKITFMPGFKKSDQVPEGCDAPWCKWVATKKVAPGIGPLTATRRTQTWPRAT